jgi:hypothetical protein
MSACRRHYPGRTDGAVRSFPIDVGLPSIGGGSAPALNFSRPAQRSLPLRPTNSPSHQRDPIHQRLQQFRYLHYCSDCYRAERTSSRAGLPPLWTSAFSRRTPSLFYGCREGGLVSIRTPAASEKTLHWFDEVSFSFRRRFQFDEARRMDRDTRPKILRYDTIHS